ncbi:MAG: CPBP family intramembrane metalloprotease, partial [Myxococcales bacterium]|nr:CPBP family intramembrane metalloprotease [Myxococcales bacterium]
YCMLHFQKTASESLGAIVAGVILGTLAMKYRSIWGGVALHWLVAISMDVLSLFHQGRLPTRLWPG